MLKHTSIVFILVITFVVISTHAKPANDLGKVASDISSKVAANVNASNKKFKSAANAVRAAAVALPKKIASQVSSKIVAPIQARMKKMQSAVASRNANRKKKQAG